MITGAEVKRRLRDCDSDGEGLDVLMDIVQELADKLDTISKLGYDTAQYVDESIESGELKGGKDENGND